MGSLIEILLSLLAETGRLVLFAITMARQIATRPPLLSAVIEQMYRVGFLSLPVLATVAVFVGSNTTLQGYTAFQPLGADSFLGMFVSLAGVRELAPLIGASIIAAKVGTEMATTLAVMRIRQQIDAMEVMAVNPYWYIISPRLVAIGLTMPILVVLADFLCLMAGYLVAVYQLGLDEGTFWGTVMGSVSLTDLGTGIIKGGVFGVCICTISCYYGFNASGGAAGVGRAANRAVVVSAMSIALLNYLLSAIFYG